MPRRIKPPNTGKFCTLPYISAGSVRLRTVVTGSLRRGSPDRHDNCMKRSTSMCDSEQIEE
jgi:hypothetical protein